MTDYNPQVPSEPQAQGQPQEQTQPYAPQTPVAPTPAQGQPETPYQNQAYAPQGQPVQNPQGQPVQGQQTPGQQAQPQPQPMDVNAWYAQFGAQNGRMPSPEEYEAAVARGEVQSNDPLSLVNNFIHSQHVNDAVNKAKNFAQQTVGDAKNFNHLTFTGRQHILNIGAAIASLVIGLTVFMPYLVADASLVFDETTLVSGWDLMKLADYANRSFFTNPIQLMLTFALLTIVLAIAGRFKDTPYIRLVTAISGVITGIIPLVFIVQTNHNLDNFGGSVIHIGWGFYVAIIFGLMSLALSAASIFFWYKEYQLTKPATPQGMPQGMPQAVPGQQPFQPAQAPQAAPQQGQSVQPVAQPYQAAQPVQPQTAQPQQFAQPVASMPSTPATSAAASTPAPQTAEQWAAQFRMINGFDPSPDEYNAARARGEFQA